MGLSETNLLLLTEATPVIRIGIENDSPRRRPLERDVRVEPRIHPGVASTA
jgi:hypothetical protein